MATGIGDELLWLCPSLDDSGNGTSTVTDLSGLAADGSLVNMDAATDWVADVTSGGVRCLETDGANDAIVVASNFPAVEAGVWGLSFWIRMDQDNKAYVTIGLSGSTYPHVAMKSAAGNLRISASGFDEGSCEIDAGSSSVGTWVHYLVEMSASGWKVYANGTLRTLTSVSGVSTSTQLTHAFATVNQFGIGGLITSTSTEHGACRWDDARFFDNARSAGERTDLASARGWEPAGASYAITEATETETAESIVASEHYAISEAVESDTAEAIIAAQTVTIAAASEANTSEVFSVEIAADYPIGDAVSVETAETFIAYDGLVADLNSVLESGLAGSVTAVAPAAYPISEVVETDTAEPITALVGASLIPYYYRFL